MELRPVWDDLRILLAVHRQRSFSAAGRTLGLSTSTTGRRIDALEKAVGRRLVTRMPSGTSVEPDALDLIRLAEALEIGLETSRRDVQSNQFAGTVRISVAHGFIRPVIEALAGYRREHPETHLELNVDDRRTDLAQRAADVGVRAGLSTSKVLIQRHIATVRFGVYGSADYVQRNLPSRQLKKKDFDRHDFIGHDGPRRQLPQEQWLVALGAKRFQFRSDSDIAMFEAVAHGMGLSAIADETAQSYGLVRIAVDSAGPTVPLFVVYHRELRSVPRVRAVVAAIEARGRALR